MVLDNVSRQENMGGETFIYMIWTKFGKLFQEA